MFSGRWNDWLYNDTENAFGVRDLGYYVGYAIAERYVERSADRPGAVTRLIELDYQDPQAVEAIVEASRYFDRALLRPPATSTARSARYARSTSGTGPRSPGSPGRVSLYFYPKP